MHELTHEEVNAVTGGARAFWISIAAAAAYDALKSAGQAVIDHTNNAEVAFKDDPNGRGRALL